MVLIPIKRSLSQSNGQLLSLLLAGNKSREIKSVCMSVLSMVSLFKPSVLFTKTYFILLTH